MGRAAASKLRQGALACAIAAVLAATLLLVMGVHAPDAHQEAPSASSEREDAASSGLERSVTPHHPLRQPFSTILSAHRLSQQGAEGSREEAAARG